MKNVFNLSKLVNKNTLYIKRVVFILVVYFVYIKLFNGYNPYLPSLPFYPNNLMELYPLFMSVYVGLCRFSVDFIFHN